MLKENETEEATDFFVTILSLVAFQLRGGRVPWPPPLATPMCQAWYFYYGKCLLAAWLIKPNLIVGESANLHGNP